MHQRINAVLPTKIITTLNLWVLRAVDYQEKTITKPRRWWVQDSGFSLTVSVSVRTPGTHSQLRITWGAHVLGILFLGQKILREKQFGLMIMNYFQKGTQLAKSHLQHQPWPAMPFPLSLQMVAKESFANFNSERTVLTHKRPTGSNKMKAVKENCKSKRYGGDPAPGFISSVEEVTAFLESRWLSRAGSTLSLPLWLGVPIF